jgi:choline dehydrogenase-like flavoprotein
MIIAPGAAGLTSYEADVVVVGAGPAGLAVASRLAARNRRVVVLESGGIDAVPDLDAGRGRVAGPVRYFDLAECRTRGLGGSAALWGGWCEPLDDLDFEWRKDMPETGWCVSRQELEPYYREAYAFCGVPRRWSSRPWRLMGKPGIRDAPFSVRSFPVLGARQLGHRHTGLFTGTGADLILGATATRLMVTGDSSAVDHLTASTRAGEIVVSGHSFVLATGAIETARLLLASASPSWPDGLGNADDLVGRCFMEHPHVDAARLSGDPEVLDLDFFSERVAGTTLDGEPMGAAGALVLGDDVCRAERIGRVQLFIEPTGQHLDRPLFGRQGQGRRPRSAPNGPRAAEDLALIAVTEQVPNRASRVMLSDSTDRHGVPLPIVHWKLADVDHRTVVVGVEAVRDLLRAAGATRIRRRVRRGVWPADTLGGPHHIGTARMALSPADGVVDADCRVHGVANLFVAGSAVFPTSGYAPPTLTIVALALRLADYLQPEGSR